MTIDHDEVFNRIRRMRNHRNPFETLAQRMEDIFRSYKGGTISENDLLWKLRQFESEAATIYASLPKIVDLYSR